MLTIRLILQLLSIRLLLQLLGLILILLYLNFFELGFTDQFSWRFSVITSQHETFSFIRWKSGKGSTESNKAK